MQLGEPRAIARAYHKLNFGHAPPRRRRPRSTPRRRHRDRRRLVRERRRRADRRAPPRRSRCACASRSASPRTSTTRCSRPRCATSSGTRSSSRARDQHGRGQRLLQAPGETAIARFAIPNWLTPSRYTLTPSVAREGTGADAIDAARGHGLAGRPRQPPAAGILELPRRRARSSAHEHRGTASAGTPGTRAGEPPRARALGARRRPAALLVADVHARANRIQAALLRLGARLRVVARAPAAAVRRAVGVLHQDRPRQRRARPRRNSSTVRSCSARSCCSPSSPKRPAARCAACVDRENLLRKIRFPRLVIPLSVVLLGAVQPGAEPDRRR